MARVGLDARTGKLLYSWAHCVQSMRKILTTELNERIQRRGFGSELSELIDRPQNEETIISAYIAVAEALEPREVEGRQYGEPGFVLLQAAIDAGVPGRLLIKLNGVFFEEGHLGDYSNPSVRGVVYGLSQSAGGITFEALS